MKKGSAKAVPAGKRTAAEKLQYVKKNWQLYVFFLLPALLLTIIFKYVPMGGVHCRKLTYLQFSRFQWSHFFSSNFS